MTELSLQIQAVDAQGEDALALLRKAALEARELYPELQDPNAPLPTNPATLPRGAYLLVYDGSRVVGSGALRSIMAIQGTRNVRAGDHPSGAGLMDESNQVVSKSENQLCVT